MANQDYTVKQLLETAACTNCHLCVDVCPVVLASQDGELSAIYRVNGLNKILKSRARLFRKLFSKRGYSDKQWKHFRNNVFRCTLCGHCEEVCPVGIHLKRLWISLRNDFVHSEFYPKKIDMIRENLKESFNVFGEENEERADWVEDMRDVSDHGYILRIKLKWFTSQGAWLPIFRWPRRFPLPWSRSWMQVWWTLRC